MADITSTIQPINLSSNKVLFWEALNNSNTRGLARKVSHFGRITIFILGNLGNSSVFIEGAGNDDGADSVPGDNQFITLLDTNNGLISFTTLPTNPRTLLTIPNWIRPNTSGGGPGKDIDIIMVCMDAKR